MASRLPVMPRAIVVQAMAFSPWLALLARAVLIGFGSVGQVGGASWGCAVSVLLPAVYVTARVAPGVYIPTLAGGCACCSCSAAAAFAAREEGVSVASAVGATSAAIAIARVMLRMMVRGRGGAPVGGGRMPLSAPATLPPLAYSSPS